MTRSDDITTLRRAFREGRITLFLGAGVSVGNGLPTWEQLVLAMYFSIIGGQRMGGWRPFPNYLLAIAEWYLDGQREPLEITARKMRRYFDTERGGDETFLQQLRENIYAGFVQSAEDAMDVQFDSSNLRSANPTLHAVAQLCETALNGRPGVRSVITYNYDNLLETALLERRPQPVFDNSRPDPELLPIYHVHGFVPFGDEAGSNARDIVFTEDQYHLSARDPYSWANLVQLSAMSGNVGLMIGLSIADRNIRRLLDAVRGSPLTTQHFALLKRPQARTPSPEDLDAINAKAAEYFGRFERSGVKRDQPGDAVSYRRAGLKSADPVFTGDSSGEPRYRYEIRKILEQVDDMEEEQQQFVLQQLGITPIWFDEFAEIGDILAEIVKNA